MCGRYVATTPSAELAELFGVTDVRAGDLARCWNVAPTMDVYAVAEGSEGERHLGTFRWGLVPWFAAAATGARMINARAETVAEKPAFRRALERRRCILPVDGFYEWLRTGKEKLPHHFASADGSVLGVAGLWEVWRPQNDPEALPLRTCAMVTTGANATMAPIHNRMPVVLPSEAWGRWLDRSVTRAADLLPLLIPAPDSLLVRRSVSQAVNNVKNDGPQLLDPVRT